jgi:protein phosphatase
MTRFSLPCPAHSVIEAVLRSTLGSPIVRSVSNDAAIAVLNRAAEIMAPEPAVLVVSGAFCVVGDLHGSLESLLRVFSHVGWPPRTKFLFLGDYVDRGEHSTEVLLTLYSLKALFPADVFLLRGNHECRSLTGCYGFREEVEKVFSEAVYEKAIESFDCLPMAAIVNDTVFCVHGGISPQFKMREDIFRIVKPKNDPVTGIEGDILWGDFEDFVEQFEENYSRGCGFVVGPRSTRDFLNGCGFTTIVRSHQSVDGADWPFGREGGCVTVFTAVDYMGKVNDGAIATVDADNRIEVVILHTMFESARMRWRPIWPIWLLEAKPADGKPAVGVPSLRRTISEPNSGASAVSSGVALRL